MRPTSFFGGREKRNEEAEGGRAWVSVVFAPAHSTIISLRPDLKRPQRGGGRRGAPTELCTYVRVHRKKRQVWNVVGCLFVSFLELACLFTTRTAARLSSQTNLGFEYCFLKWPLPRSSSSPPPPPPAALARRPPRRRRRRRLPRSRR